MAGKKDLVQVIRDNPGCVAIVDNDHWTLWREHPNSEDAPADDDEYAKWEKAQLLAEAGQVEPLGAGGYGSGNCYGGDLLQALAKIVGITVESV